MRSIFAVFVLALTTFTLSACGSSSSDAPPRTAAQLDDGTYYTGMLLYSKEVSQLSDGTIIGYRLSDSDGTTIVERIGVLTVNTIDASGANVTWHTYDTDKTSGRSTGSAVLSTDGDGIDLDNDGEADLHYVSSPAPRDGLTDERYLKFALFHRGTSAKRLSFRIVDNGETAPVVAARPILQFDHDGTMLVSDRKLPLVTDFANDRIEYGDAPAIDLLRKNDYLLIDLRISFAQAQAKTTAANASFSGPKAFAKGNAPSVSSKWPSWSDLEPTHWGSDIKKVYHKTKSLGETAIHDVKNTVDTFADDVNDELGKILPFWSKIMAISYTGTPLTVSGIPFRQDDAMRVKSDGVFGAGFDDGHINISGSADLAVEYTISISLNPISFAEGALTGHPGFSLFSISSKWFPTILPTVTFNNMTEPYSKEIHIPLSSSIELGDTPFSLTPALLGLKVECDPGNAPLNGNVNFMATGDLNLAYDQGSPSGSGTGSVTLLSQNAFTATNGASCTVGVGPASELSAAELVHLPVTNWFELVFMEQGIYPGLSLTAGLSVGFQGITIWDIGEATLWSQDLGMIAY